MDKTEYRMKLDEINRLVDAQDYEGALAIVDSIDWRRVKSVRTLCMVADIYEVNGELSESMKMLQLAYKRSSVGKMILYRQVELSLKMGRYDDAVDYYNQYLETAANDTSKYILKYKIYKAQDAPLEEQIAILEEYKDREYTERWVYELAKLYKKAGKQNKCIAACDDLILWFGEGKYVTKAMELKMTYVPLTPAQKAKYDQRNRVKENVKQEPKPEEKTQTVTASTVAGISAAAMASLQKASIIPGGVQNTPKEDSSAPVKTVGMEEAAATVETEQSEKEMGAGLRTDQGERTPEVKAEPVHVDTAQLQEKLAKSFQEVLSGFNRTKVVNAFEALGRATGSEVPQESAEEENIEEYQVKDLEPETANETKISAERGEAIAHRTEIPESAEPVAEKKEKPEDREVTSIQDMDLEALFAETSSLFAEAAGNKNAETQEEEVTFLEPDETASSDEIPVESVEKADTESEAENEVQKEEKQEPDTVIVEENVGTGSAESQPELDADAEAAMAAFEASLLGGFEDIPEFAESNEKVEEDAWKPAAEESLIEEPATEESAAEEAIIEEPVIEEPVIEESVIDEPVIDEPVIEESAIEEPVVEEIVFEEQEDEVSTVSEEISSNEESNAESTAEPEEYEEDDVKIAPPVGGYQEINLEEQLLAALGERQDEKNTDDDELLNQMQNLVGGNRDEQSVEQPEDTQEESFIPDLDLDIVMELQREKEEPEKEETEKAEPEVSETEQMLAEAEAEPELTAPAKETPEEKRMRILNATRPERLTDEQKRLFSYFSKVPGMDEQILEAIEGVYQHVDEKTSRRGNIAIMGSHGTGKTRLSEGLVKAICKELGLKAVKYANLDASDMNRKDPASVIGKMAGGFLLIERASYMNAETIEKLSQAMDFRTDSMILIIEDDKANMRKMLADYPEFAKKFNTVISIPVFTNDELVTFARTYARENGYRMDEMGVLALYTLIGDNQREDEPITIGKVKEMVDGAIRRAGGARLGRRISKRHTDEDGRILLYEKDFDL